MKDYLYLIKSVDFSKDYENVITFDTQELQRSFFINQSTQQFEVTKIRIVNGTGVVRVPLTQPEANEYSYIIWRTTDINGKVEWKFGFIDDTAYVQQDVTDVSIDLDVWQTYQFEHEVVDSFLERGHVDRWTIDGKPIYNLEKEELELGEDYETLKTTIFKDDKELLPSSTDVNVLWYYVVSSAPLLDKRLGVNNHKTFRANGIATGYYLYSFPVIKEARHDSYSKGQETTFLGYDNLNKIVIRANFYNYETIEDILSNPSVTSVYISPYSPIEYSLEYNEMIPGSPHGSSYSMKTYNVDWEKISGEDKISAKLIQIINLEDKKKEFDITEMTNLYKPEIPNHPSYFGGVHPDNEPKLFTKPYTVMSFTNHLIEPLDVGLDEIKNNKVYFEESLGVQYKGLSYVDKYDDSKYFNSIISTKNSEVPLLSDRYKEYMMNNKASATTGVALSGMGAVAGLGVGGALTGLKASFPGASLISYMSISQGVTSSKSVLAHMVQKSDLKQTPLSIRETGNDITFLLNQSFDKLFFTGYVRRPKEQFFTRALRYFHRYGYTVNNQINLDIRSRYYFNYVSCLSVQIKGDISNRIKVELEKIYKQGTTFWHNRNDGIMSFEMYKYGNENMEMILL